MASVYYKLIKELKYYTNAPILLDPGHREGMAHQHIVYTPERTQNVTKYKFLNELVLMNKLIRIYE